MAIFLYTGNGGGKTSAAFGIALRALGHNKDVLVVQFMKGRRNVGEYKIQKKLKNLRIVQFGRRKFINLKKPAKKDKVLGERALDYLKFLAGYSKKGQKKNVKTKLPFLIVLDEVNLAVKIGLIDAKETIRVIEKIAKKSHVILTGRYASKEFIRVCDSAMELKPIKLPKKPICIKGLNY